MSLGALVVNLSANIAQFTSDMGRASQVTEQAMNRMGSAADRVKNLLGMVGVGLSVGMIVNEINKTIGALADLDDMAQKTGASVENLSRLSKVATMTGVDFNLVDGAIVKLAKNLSEVDDKGNKTAKALAAIGISTAAIKGQDPAQVFSLITQKLQGYEDGAGKVALSTDLMGKSAANLLPYMNDFAENIDRFTGDSAEAAAKATELQDSLGLMRVKYEELKTEILIGAVPATADFIQALMDTKREAGNLGKDTSMNTWADDAGLILSRLVDRVKLTARALMMVGSSVKAVAADIQVAASLNPAVMAYEISQGRNPLDRFRATMAERETIVKESNAKLEAFLNAPMNATEEAFLKRMRGRQNGAGMAMLAGMAGASGIGSGPGRELNYSSGDGDKADKKKKDKEVWTGEAAADRMMKFALDETLAMKNTAQVTEDLIEADTKRFEQKMRQAEQITAGAENIRLSLMTEAEAAQFEHDSRIQQLQEFSALKLENEQQANALIEAETARHVQAKADMERMHQLQVLGMAGNSADQLYNLMEQAGLEQTALGKALFIANKAIAVAEIIMNTELAAAKALAMGPIVGPPLAAVIRGMGYASAGIVIGTTIASAEDGYDIPAGTNPVTQLHEKEMVLPKAQAEVIRSLATNGGARGGGGAITYSPQIHIDSRTDQGEVRKLVYTAVQQGNADLVDKLARAGRI